MSAYSEWKCGALSDEQFQQCGVSFNAEEKAYQDKLDSIGCYPHEDCVGCDTCDREYCEKCPNYNPAQ